MYPSDGECALDEVGEALLEVFEIKLECMYSYITGLDVIRFLLFWMKFTKTNTENWNKRNKWANVIDIQ